MQFTHIKLKSRSIALVICFMGLMIAGMHSAYAQCNFVSPYGTATAPAAGITTTITTCQYGGEYATINSAVAGNSYTNTSSVTTDWITIRQGTPGGTVVAFGPTPLTWTASVAGAYYAHYSTNSACGTAAVCRTTTIIGRGTGCLNTIAYTSAPAPTTATLTTVSSCIYAQEYHTVTGALAGAAYQVTSSVSTDYLTVRQGSYNGPVVAKGPTPLNFYTAIAGNYYIHVNTNTSCGVAATCRNLQMSRLYAPAGGTGCTNLSMYPGAFAAPAAGTTYTISTCQFQSEYNQMTGVVSGNTFVSTGSIAGTYITIRYGTYNGALVASGTSPLSWTATAGAGSYFIHYNTSAACGTATTCMTSTIQNTTPVPFDPCASIGAITSCGVSNVATIASGSGVWALGPFLPGGKEKLFTFTPTTTGNYTITQSGNTGGSYIDYFFKAASGGCNNTGWTFVQDLFGAPVTSFASMSLTAGVQYYIMLDPEYTTGTTVTFSINCVCTPPAGDVLGTAIPVGALPYTTTGDNLAANCWTNNIGQTSPDVYYQVIPTCNGTMNMSMCGGGTMADTYIHILNAAGTILASNDDFGPSCASALASLNYTVTAGTTYYVVCEGYSTNQGTYSLSVSLTPTVVTFYADADGDTYGNAGVTTTTCNGTTPAGYVLNSTDCNDANSAVYPGAAEVCNAIDDDCDGSTDDGLTFLNYYTDADGDSYGDVGATPVSSCAPVAGSVTNNTDCNDANSAIYPGATEVCNAIDDDCDGTADDGIAFSTYYADADGDGFGDAATSSTTCDGPPAGYITDNSDCDDTQTTYVDLDGDGFGSGSPVTCGVGNNSDCYPLDMTYGDVDGDGYGSDVLVPCGIGNSDDCDDNALLYTDIDGDGFGSGSPVACGVADNSDCYPLDITYADLDGDGHGSATMAPCGILSSDDCDDSNSSIHPGAAEICNGIDEDCDGSADDGLIFLVYYTDADGDGYGDAGATPVTSCAPVAGAVANSGDCDDANASINPAATEICNGVDDNCSGGIDDGLTFLDYYADGDGDGYGDAGATAVNSCSPVAGSVTNNGDCDDANASINPAATEICNGVDDNCSGSIDDGLTFLDYYTDADGDGYGDVLASPVNSCAPIAGSVTDNSDCNDSNASINPGAAELCNAIDDDCDGTTDDGLTFTTYYADGDGDGYGNAAYGVISTCDGMPAGYAATNDDCLELNAAVYPGATEVCNGIDDDCDGTTDDGLPFTTYYADGDGDGYGNAAYGVVSTCDGMPAGYAATNDDCLEMNAAVYPGAPELCNAIDDDCDGSVDDGLTFTTYYADADGDGYGNAGATSSTCDGAPAGYVTDNTDCDDAFSTVYPGASEVCDGLDNDCDGDTDEATATASITPTGVVTICKSDPELLVANTGIGYTYQWFKNGNMIPGATASTYSASKPGYYQVQVNIPEGCFALSDVTTINTNPNPNANISAPNGTSLCATVKLKASWDATYTWQWLLEGAPIPGATDYLYFPVTPGNYSCTITNNFGCFRTTATMTVTACKDEVSTATVNEVFELYPNPTEGLFTLNMELDTESKDALVFVQSIVGELVYGGTIAIDHGTVNAAISLGDDVSAGMYIVKVVVDSKEYTKQLVIQK